MLFTLTFFAMSSFAKSNFMEFGNVNFGRDFKDKSKWYLKLGSETIRFASNLPEYKGEHVSVEDGEVDDLNGYGLSFGRDFYLGAGVSTSFSIGAYYSKTLDKIIGKAAKDIDLDFAETRTAHQLTAYEAAVSLNYLFDYKVVDIQPFIEAGIGAGEVITEKEYYRLGIDGFETNGSEEYDVSVRETFALTRISLGVNFISYKGLMSYFKVTTMPLVVSDRETDGQSNVKGSATIIDLNNNESGVNDNKTLTLVSVGIGSYF